MLFTHPINRSDLPFTTLTGLVDCDTFRHTPIHFPARWNDANFNGVLPKGTPVAQCLPVKRELWSADFEELSGDGLTRMIETQDWRRGSTASIAASSGCRSARAQAFRRRPICCRRAKTAPRRSA